MREELIRALAEGRMRLHELPADLSGEEAAEIRRAALEQLTGANLVDMARYSIDFETAARRNCENMIGIAQVPIGVAGPLLLRGKHVDGEIYVPLATTEGALVASVNRGCTAIKAAGGASAFVEDTGMTRAPVFRTESMAQTQEFLAWVRAHEEDIRELAESTSRHLRLIDIRPFAFGTSVWLRFRFMSGDAMGMNMATIAAERVCRKLIGPRTGVECVALSGNYCIDKKPASVNWQEGRGKRLHAEVVLPKEVLETTLKTTAQALAEVSYRKNLLGSIAAGANGYNAHFANVVSAYFIATGQDVAHVVGGSTGITTIEARGEDAYVSIYIPDMPLGAVGGGTSLNTQSEGLRLIGAIPDPDRPGWAARRVGEILAGAVLAGEISLMAAFTSNDLARAHKRLARGQPHNPSPGLPFPGTQADPNEA
ncbi:MAG: hydroxymethylglutaryl-CoA reductase (NADPH) [Planctomycetes bacterium]|nr:hydroxymethylglutaryl-CoA reductase (NADPH) [Planctomycetota bacterium]